MVGSNDDNYEVLKEICERHNVLRLDLHGSTLTGEDFPDQDDGLNFLVEFLPMEPKEHVRVYSALEEEIEKFFGKKVYVLDIGGIKLDILRRQLTKRRRLLYAAEDQDES